MLLILIIAIVLTSLNLTNQRSFHDESEKSDGMFSMLRERFCEENHNPFEKQDQRNAAKYGNDAGLGGGGKFSFGFLENFRKKFCAKKSAKNADEYDEGDDQDGKGKSKGKLKNLKNKFCRESLTDAVGGEENIKLGESVSIKDVFQNLRRKLCKQSAVVKAKVFRKKIDCEVNACQNCFKKMKFSVKKATIKLIYKEDIYNPDETNPEMNNGGENCIENACSTCFKKAFSSKNKEGGRKEDLMSEEEIKFENDQKKERQRMARLKEMEGKFARDQVPKSGWFGKK